MSTHNHEINQITTESPAWCADKPQSLYEGFSSFCSISFLHTLLFAVLFYPLQKWFGLLGEDRLQGPTIYRRIYRQCYKSEFCFHRCSPLMASGVLPKRLTLKVDGEPQMVDRCRSSVSWFSISCLLLCLFHPTPVRWGYFTCMKTTFSRDFPKFKGLIKSRVP